MYKILSRITIIILLCLFSQINANVTTDSSSANRVDIDLSRMSATMVYSMVYQMVTEPKKFIGKRIKMKGSFSSYYDEAVDRRFFGCVIKDALACCSQGLAFETFKPRKYPKDFPREGSPITIIGRFDYEKEEDGIGFPIIRNAIFIE